MSQTTTARRMTLRVASRPLGGAPRPARVRTRGLGADGVADEVIMTGTRSHEDEKEGFFNLPELGGGEDVFAFDVPDGLLFAHVDLIVEDASPLARASIEDRPERGAAGKQGVTVAWSHPPWGKIRYRVEVHASPDGRSAPVSVSVEEASAQARARLLVEQDVPFDAVLSGPIAQTFKALLEKKAKEQGGPVAQPQVAGADDAAVIAAVLAISLALIALTAIALGMLTFAALCYFAMQKGYNLEDTGYEVQTGQGDSKQVHKIRFKVRKPGT